MRQQLKKIFKGGKKAAGGDTTQASTPRVNTRRVSTGTKAKISKMIKKSILFLEALCMNKPRAKAGHAALIISEPILIHTTNGQVAPTAAADGTTTNKATVSEQVTPEVSVF
jgi:hypothetical protein